MGPCARGNDRQTTNINTFALKLIQIYNIKTKTGFFEKVEKINNFVEF